MLMLSLQHLFLDRRAVFPLPKKLNGTILDMEDWNIKIPHHTNIFSFFVLLPEYFTNDMHGYI